MTMRSPLVSVIIPCYNQGQYIDEAVNSVLAQSYKNLEIIIVNDGSSDLETNQILNSYSKPKTIITHTINQGLPSARNYGISISNGKYILPLDADDKIGDLYIEKAVDLLENNDNLGIVYCQAEFFGNQTGRWELNEYRFPDILLGNVIFCSGLFRKSDWQEIGGYSTKMIYGWEDYDFWLSIIEMGREVYRIPDILFFYRRKKESMTESMNEEKFIYSYTEIFKNHPEIYIQNISIIFTEIIRVRSANSNLQSQISDLQSQISDLQSQIKNIKSSKFWRMRDIWLQAKSFMNFLSRT